ncbi:MAG: hypothetical protein AAGC55_05995 [Myxococcota bacterium]
MRALSTIELEGYDNWIAAMDVTTDGKLIIGAPAHTGGLHIFDVDSGALSSVISPLSAESSTGDDEPTQLWGLDCVSRAAPL